MTSTDLPLFLEQAPVAVAMFDLEMRCVAASHRWIVEHELDGAVIGKTLPEAAPGMKTLDESLRLAFTGESITRPPDCVELRNGGVRWVRSEIRPWRRQDDRISGAVVFVEDVTSHLHQRLVETTTVGLLLLDPDGRMAFINTCAAEMLAYPAERMIGVPLTQLIDENDTAPAGAKLETREACSHELKFRRGDGSTLMASLSLNPIYEQGAHKGAAATLAEMTDCDQSNGCTRTFLGALAHDLRNPLATINMTVEQLQASYAHEDRHGVRLALERAARQGRRLDRLISELADVSSMSHDSIDLRKQPVDLTLLLQDAIESVRSRIAEGACELVVSLPGRALPIVADPARIRQTLHTLLDNAIKYTDRGGVIEVDANRAGSNAIVTVRDDGVGIARDQLALIFDPFRQRNPQRKANGLGVGLALARHWLRLHGGELEAKSDGPGEGSLFVARVPLHD